MPTNKANPNKKPNKASAITDKEVAIVHTMKKVIIPPPTFLTNIQAIIRPVIKPNTSNLRPPLINIF